MKSINILVLWFCIPFILKAQDTAFFETVFLFKDAAGNRDSIVVGHDIAANAFYNPQYGEAHIPSPWDSVFEVRAAHYLAWNQMDDSLILSKKIVGDNENGFHQDYNCLWFNEAVIFFMRVINFPFTVYWNREDFEGSYCRNRSTLTPNLLPMIAEEWWPDLEEDVDYICLAERDSFIVSSFNYKSFDFYRIDLVEGGVMDTIFALLFVPRDQIAFNSPCTSTVSSVQSNQRSEILLYPNPATDFVIIQNGDDLHWQIIDPLSHMINKGKGSNIELAFFGKGLYFITISDDKGNLIYTGRIIKL